uniref:Uncharacterized protein n=1 Tax=Anopheles culicifacies TaxID=139723 RepID=A0A182M5S4_9DIPT
MRVYYYAESEPPPSFRRIPQKSFGVPPSAFCGAFGTPDGQTYYLCASVTNVRELRTRCTLKEYAVPVAWKRGCGDQYCTSERAPTTTPMANRSVGVNLGQQ